MIIISAQAVIPPRNLQKMLYDKETITALAKQIVAAQVEAHIEMGSDFGAEYNKFEEVEQVIQDAKVTAEDYIEDLLTEFRGMLYDAVRATEIKVKTVSFEKDGFVDAVVEVL